MSSVRWLVLSLRSDRATASPARAGSSRPAASGSTSTPRRARRSTSSTSSRTAAAAGSGRPMPKAPCPTCRSSSRTTSAAKPMSCSAASSPTCCRSTPASGATEERKTLGFHLSARFPFSDVIVRAASDEDIHWSLSGNPDLRRARPLPRLPRHRHRPHRAAPVRAGNHEACAVQFARPACPTGR